MYTRLAFSVAVHANPDIVIIDEVLAVGDHEFQDKCLDRIAQLREEGKTILFVSHDQKAMRTIADRVIWIDKGVKRMDGPPDEVLDAYLAHLPAGKAEALR
ncbi:Teichoic acids export ATP-binding protein TagH [compost metagenome]